METINATHPAIAWYAGLFDGEGCIQFAKHPGPLGPSYHVTLTMGNTFGEAVRLFERRWGGSMTCYKEDTRNRRRKFYLWTLSGKVARRALTEMLPHLVVKAEQARTVISYYALPWRGKQGKQRSLEQVATDKTFFDQVVALKKFTPTYSWEHPI